MKIHKALLIGYLVFMIGTLFEMIPMVYACLIMALAMLVSIRSQRHQAESPVDFIALFLAAASMGICTLVKGSTWTLPYMGSFFYGGFTAAHALRLIRSGSNRDFRKLDGLSVALFTVALTLSLVLFPDPQYIWLPPLLSVLPVLIIGRKLSPRYTPADQASTPGSLRNTFLTLIIVAILFSFGFFIMPHRAAAVLPQETIHRIEELSRNYQLTPDADSAMLIAQLYFFNGRHFDSEAWFNKASSRHPVTAKAYMATILGIRARDGGSPLDRVRWVKESVQQLDSLVRTNPDDIELRLIRSSYYLELPDNFKMNETGKADARWILSNPMTDSLTRVSAGKLLAKQSEKK